MSPGPGALRDVTLQRAVFAKNMTQTFPTPQAPCRRGYQGAMFKAKPGPGKEQISFLRCRVDVAGSIPLVNTLCECYLMRVLLSLQSLLHSSSPRFCLRAHLGHRQAPRGQEAGSWIKPPWGGKSMALTKQRTFLYLSGKQQG